jgi:SAM-dependent methyltransferase
MTASADTNERIWKSETAMSRWFAGMDERDRGLANEFALLARLLPFSEDDSFTFLDLGAGAGAASRTVLSLYPRSTAILADYSPHMIARGAKTLAAFEDRFRYVAFDLLSSRWPEGIPDCVDAVVSSQCFHHVPDPRKRTLFAEILGHLPAGGWFFNFDPVQTSDPTVRALWNRISAILYPDSHHYRSVRTPQEQAAYENHIQHLSGLDTQLGFLREAGFEAIDVYWKRLDQVIYGGRRPLDASDQPR